MSSAVTRFFCALSVAGLFAVKFEYNTLLLLAEFDAGLGASDAALESARRPRRGVGLGFGTTGWLLLGEEKMEELPNEGLLAIFDAPNILNSLSLAFSLSTLSFSFSFSSWSRECREWGLALRVDSGESSESRERALPLAGAGRSRDRSG